MNRPAASTRRMFFALWPDTQVREQLAATAGRCSTRPVPTANLHTTLVFMGNLDEEQQHCCHRAAAHLQGEAFELVLDRLVFRKRRGMLWLGTGTIPAALTALVSALEQALTRCGHSAEARTYLPHVTLSRKMKQAPAQTGVRAIHWAVREFVLAESIPIDGHVIYRLAGRWKLD